MIKIYDDVLDNEIYEKINSVFLSNYFPYYYVKGVSNEFEDDYIFVHTILKYQNGQKSDYFNLLKPIYDFLKEKENLNGIIGVRVVFKNKNNSFKKYDLHVDLSMMKGSYKTSIYYLNTTNGKTYFENNQTIDCVKNRLISFPGNIKHAGYSHTDTNYKLIVNINYTVKDEC